MSEKISLQNYDDRADPANEASRNEAWGVDPKEFASGNEYIHNRPDTEVSADVDDIIFEKTDAGKDIYSDRSLMDIAHMIRESNENNDKSTSLELQAEIEDRLHSFIESGQLTEDGALARLEQLMAVWTSDVEDTNEAVPGEGATYSELTNAEKEEFHDYVKKTLHGIKESGQLKQMSAEEGDAYLKKFREGMLRDGGIEADELDAIIEGVVSGDEKGATASQQPEQGDDPAVAEVDSSTPEGSEDDSKSNDEPQRTPQTNLNGSAPSPADINDTEPILQQVPTDEQYLDKPSFEEQRIRDLDYLWEFASNDERERMLLAAYGQEEYDKINRDKLDALSKKGLRAIVDKAFKNGYRLPGEESKELRKEKLDDMDRFDAPQASTSEKAGLLGQANEAIVRFAGKIRDWQKLSKEKYAGMDRRDKRIALGVVLGATGLAGAVTLAWLNHKGFDTSAALGEGADLSSVSDVPTPEIEVPKVESPDLKTLENTVVQYGEGVYDLLAKNGIDKSAVPYSELYELQKQFPGELYLEQVGNVMDVRIANQGTISQQLADALAKLA